MHRSRHHDFFKRGVASTLAQAVDRALNLTRTANGDASERVGDRHTKVVMAMHRPDRFVGVWNALAKVSNQLTEELGHRIAHRIGDVDGGGALADHVFNDPAQKINIRAAAVFRRKLHVVGELARETHSKPRLFVHLLGRHTEFFLHVQRRGGNEGVNAR
jgi:hypothetical protein